MGEHFTLSRRAEAELAHAARVSTLGELTASIAHEVKQPLPAVVTYGEAGVCTENLIRVDDVMESPKLAE